MVKRGPLPFLISVYVPSPDEIDRKLKEKELLRLQTFIDHAMSMVMDFGTPLKVFAKHDSDISSEELGNIVNLIQEKGWKCKVEEWTPVNNFGVQIARPDEEFLD